MCEDGAVIRRPRLSFHARVGVVLAAFLVCPLMAAADAAPATPGCHEDPAPESGDGSAPLRCCDAVVAEKGKSAPEATAAPAPTSPPAAPAGRCPKWRTERFRTGFPSPPAFVRHAALLI